MPSRPDILDDEDDDNDVNNFMTLIRYSNSRKSCKCYFRFLCR
jgi:hypothetical protein